MGTPAFAVPSLKILLDNNYPIVGVVTVPDKPAGRGQQISSSAIKQFSVGQQLEILQPEKLNDRAFIEQLQSLKPDLFVVVAFRILPAEVFTIPKLGAFNLHASLLPKYRGAAPINWAIIKGERETGVTTFFLEEKVDTGSMILQARVPIKPDETAGELFDKLSEVGAEIVLHTVRLIEMGKAVPKPQDNALASPAPKIFKEQCKIDWSKSASEVHDFIRGLSPKPCAFTRYGEIMLNVYRSKVVENSRTNTPGEIVKADEQLVVSTANGAIEILEIQQEGKKKLSAVEFLRGSRITVGERLSP
jgi:methionyl-tRNA formyltransferase